MASEDLRMQKCTHNLTSELSHVIFVHCRAKSNRILNNVSKLSLFIWHPACMIQTLFVSLQLIVWMGKPMIKNEWGSLSKNLKMSGISFKPCAQTIYLGKLEQYNSRSCIPLPSAGWILIMYGYRVMCSLRSNMRLLGNKISVRNLI